MLAILASLVLAQSINLPNERGPIFSQPSLMGSLAYFEAFPSNGRGSGAVAPLPNWAIQSEAFETGSWIASSVVVGLPTITANYATAPDGTLTADRVQFAATTAAQEAVVYQPGAVPLVNPASGGVQVKGTSGSGTIAFIINRGGGNYACGTCAYNPTTWTQCSNLGANVASVGNMIIGNESSICGNASYAANDVLLWGAQTAVGSTLPPYVKTTTAAMGYTPTGAKGEVLSSPRTSAAFAQKTASGGLATTLISDGDLILMPANQPRVVYDANGVLGLLVESARANVELQSQAIDGAPWVNSAVPTVPTLNGANAATAPDGTLTAEDYTFVATTGAQYSARAQVLTCPVSTTDTASIFIKGQSGSGTTDLCIQTNEAGPILTCASCAFVSTSWSRCTLTAAVGAGVSSAGSFYVGNMTAWNSGTVARASNRVYVWGAQCEAGGYATSYIPTTSAAVTRNPDDPTFAIPSLTVTAPWSIAGSLSSPGGNMANARYHGTLGVAGLATYVTDSYSLTADSTQVTPNSYSTGISATSCTTFAGCRAATYHDGTLFNGCKDGTCAAGVARAWTPLASVTVYKPGMYSSSNGVVDGVVSRLCFDNASATRCR